ncbi:unnamed protein product [Linum tenue]|uniref:Uncharacterized protein n=1 Tax=Linum tenue TaxID=586396 RepID=A0AAV0R3V6_9ROSI|nr:unnamed protein product [Linum tenue]
MNHFVIQQSAFSRREEIRRSAAGAQISERREAVVCPKPRRLGLLADTANDHPLRSLRWQLSHQAEICDSKAGNDLLDIILSKGDGNVGREQPYPQHVATSPPFFSGSPPRRVANPLIQDARFGGEEEEELSLSGPFTPPPRVPPPSGGISSPSPRKGGGCVVRSNFGNKPAVRVEGFDCLDRDSRNCSIPALA